MFRVPDEILAARVVFNDAFPYFQSVLWALRAVEAKGLGTTAVDAKGRWYIDPDVLKTWPLPKLVVVLAHECIHIISRHCLRLAHVDDQMRANYASDLAANSWLKGILSDANALLDARMKAVKASLGAKAADMTAVTLKEPNDWLVPSMFGLPEGLTAEEYAELLRDNEEFKKQARAAQSRVVLVSGGGAGQGQGQEDQGQAGQGQGCGQRKPAPGCGSCGSCADGKPAPWELKDGDGSLPGDDKLPPGLTEAEIEVLVRSVAHAVQEHSRSRGIGMGGMELWADEFLTPPKIDWRRQLRSAVRGGYHWAAGMEEPSWRRVSRRSRDIMFPGYIRPVPTVCYVIDTSGSMGPDDIQKVYIEAQGVLDSLGRCPTHMLACDYDVHTCQKITDVRQLVLKGGGGTDMCRGIAHALTLRPRPSLIIVGTDGYTPWPDAPIPGVRVIALLTQAGSPEPPPWIVSVNVED